MNAPESRKEHCSIVVHDLNDINEINEINDITDITDMYVISMVSIEREPRTKVCESISKSTVTMTR
jgi:hypothetical protein